MERDKSDLLFRILFSSIFIALGGEHIVDDHVILAIMPSWLPLKELLSFLAGLYLLAGGTMILLGFRVKVAAYFLGFFLIVVSLLVHAPELSTCPETLPAEWAWLWQVFQRSNLVKNLCLLGVCFHLIHHQVGRYSLDHWISTRKN